MSALRRTKSNGFSTTEAHTPADLKTHAEKYGSLDALMLGAEKAIRNAVAIKLGDAEAQRFANGQKFKVTGSAMGTGLLARAAATGSATGTGSLVLPHKATGTGSPALVYAGGELLGVGKLSEGILVPKKVIKEEK
jgi:tRNA U55 pseudouridine synthase TruB